MPTARRRRRSLSVVVVLLTLLAVGLGPGPTAARASGPPVISATWSSAVGSSSRHSTPRSTPTAPPPTTSTTPPRPPTRPTKRSAATTGSPAPCARRSSGEYTLGLSSPDGHQTALFSLTAATTYRYRVVAANGNGSTTATLPDACTPSPPRAPARPAASTTAAGRWSPRSTKTAARSTRPGRSPAAACCRPPPQGGSVTYGSSASFSGGQGRLRPPPSTSPPATPSGWVDPEHHRADLLRHLRPRRRGRPLPALLHRPRPRPAPQRRPLPRRRQRLRGRQPAARRLRRPGGLSGLLPARQRRRRLHRAARRRRRRPPSTSPPPTSTCASPAPRPTSPTSSSPPARRSPPTRPRSRQGPGCDPTEQNLYEWTSGAAACTLLNGATPGAALAAQSGAISTDGDRVYWTDTASGDLYLHDGTATTSLDSGPASFQTATPDGAIAFYTKAGTLYSYDAAAHTSSAALAGGVLGVLGASANGDTVYYQDASGLQRWHSGTPPRSRPTRRARRRRRRLERLPAHHRHRPGQRRRHQAALPLHRAADRL